MQKKKHLFMVKGRPSGRMLTTRQALRAMKIANKLGKQVTIA